MQAYSYHDSGIEWLGKIPSHWQVDRLRDQVIINDEALGTNTPADYEIRYLDISNVNSRGIVDIEEIRPLTFDEAPSRARRKVKQFDTVISSVRTNLQAVAYIDFAMENLVASTGFFVCRPKFEVILLPKYLYFFLLTEYSKEYFFSRSTGISYPAIDDYDLGSIYIPLPPTEEQRAIAAYLDEACAKIDAAIQVKREQLEKITSHYRSRVYEVITSGLNTDAETKASGSVWLGDVPKHWKVRRLKYLAEIMRGKFNHRPRNDPEFYDGEYPFIQTGDVSRADKYIRSYTQTLNERGYAVSKEFPTGTLTMTIAANIGDVAILNFDACFPDSVIGFKPHHDVDLEFLYYMLLALRQDVMSTAIITTQLNLNIVRVGSTLAVVPPLEEQQQIVTYLNQLKQKTDGLSERLNGQIVVLEAYKKSLIHECVTGKKQVWQGN